MRVYFLIASSVVAILILGVAMFNQAFTAQGASPRLHKKELPEYGVLIINSADPTYENDENEWRKDKNSSFQQVATTLRPFSVFVRNTTDKDILAYKLNWELKMTDGSIVNHPRSYFSPTYLMGVPRSDQYDGMMESIKRNSSHYFAMIRTPFDTVGGGGGVGSVSVNTDEIERFQGAVRNNDMAPFIARISEQLSHATDVTVTIESLLFDDGGFVGPAGDIEFIKLKAYVAAKHDLLKAIGIALKASKTEPKNILTGVESIADEEAEMPTPNSSFGVYYNFYRKLHAQEIKNSRQAFGNDEKTLNIFVSMLDRKWIIPYERLGQESNR